MTDIQELERRVDEIAKKQEGHTTVFVKVLPILEETRMRVSSVEVGVEALAADVAQINTRLGRVESRLGRVEAQIMDLRRDLPSMMAETMREVLKETKGGA